MSPGSRVLLIDGIAETQQVLQAMLEPRGCRIDRVRGGFDDGGSNGGSSAGDRSNSGGPDGGNPVDACEPSETSPQLLVIDLDEPSSRPVHAKWQKLPRLLLGSETVDVPADNARFLAKPFEYPELLQVVEEMLTARRTA